MSDEHPTGERPATPDEPLDDPWLVDRVLSGEASDEWSSLAELFAAAAGPAQPDELRGEADAIGSFVAAREAAASGGESRSGSRAGNGGRRVAAVSTLLAGRFAAVTVAGVVTLGAGGMAAAAYTGRLPAPLQDVAHRTIGAPMPQRTTTPPTPTPSPTGSTSDAGLAATTAAAPQVPRANPAPGTSSVVTTAPTRTVTDLCSDWRQQQMPTAGPVFTALSQAVSGPVDAFCASLTTPTTAPTTTPTASSTSEPTATPSDTATSTGTPSSGPSTASDSPSGPPMTASDQPSAPVTPTSTGTGLPTTEPTGP